MHLWFSAPILFYTIRAQVTTKMPTVSQNHHQIPNVTFQLPSVTFSNFPFLKPYSIGWLCGKSTLIQLSMKANIKGKASMKSLPLETVLPSGVHVRSVRAALFCSNPISIRFQYQSSLWLLILCRTISKSLICLLEPLLAPFPSPHLPSSLALTSHCLREPAGN